MKLHLDGLLSWIEVGCVTSVMICIGYFMPWRKKSGYLRMNLHRQATLNATAVCDIVISNEDVQFYWCIVMAQYQQ